MQEIADFLQWFADTLGTLIDFVGNFIESLIDFFAMIPTVLTFTTSAIGYLPTTVMIYATVAVTVAVTLLVLGRSNN